jgi:pimeloyl-ACP methyl ester carboxylesterase
VSANGIRLHTAETGSGPLVLMLHGFPEFWYAWREQLTAFGSAGYRAVAVDLRGYGDSDKPPRGYDGWTLAGDVAGLIKALGESQAHLVGHAWGGLIAWTVAALHPRLVRSVSALAAPHPLALRRALFRGVRRTTRSRERPARPLRDVTRNSAVERPRRVGQFGEVFRAQLPIMPERALVADRAVAVERLLRRWSGPVWPHTEAFTEVADADRAAMLVPGVAHSSLEYLRWAVRSQLRGDGRRFADELDRRLTMPALQVHGAADPYLLESTALASRPWLPPKSVYQSLPGVRHFPHHEAPAIVNELLLAHFERVQAAH